MKYDWDADRRPENMAVREWELEKTPEMQRRRELTMLYQETAFLMGYPLYGLVSIDALTDPEDVKELTDVLPEARTAILMGVPIDDPWQRMWQRIPGISMSRFGTYATASTEMMLLQFAEILETQGYQAIVKQLPLTPTNERARLFELAGAGFMGKNHLVVTDKDGCRVNLGIIITDAPLLHGDYRYDSYNQNECGDCTLCEDYCPCGALKDGQYDQAKCEAYVNHPENQWALTPHSIFKCDMCMRICPLGKVGKWDTRPVTWQTIIEEEKLNH
jgi:epoxyqueuosine reductase QueG